MTTTPSPTTPGPTTGSASRRRPLWRAVDLALVALLVAIGGLLAVRAAEGAVPWSSGPSDARPVAVHVPRNEALEKLTGVRISQVAVVGDGGLVTVFYVVLDPERATQFQADRAHTPTLSSESRKASTEHTSIMRAGHAMRAGATYYLVYENGGGGILKSGELTTVTYRGVSLRHVPVL